MRGKDDSVSMIRVPMRVTREQKQYLDYIGRRDGNATHFIRIALDIHIERDRAKADEKEAGA